MPSINYFQAAAELIPTLLIALAFASRFLTIDEKGFIRSTPWDAVWSVLLFIGIPLVSLGVTLATLATNNPTVVARYIVELGIALLMGFIFLQIIGHVVKERQKQLNRSEWVWHLIVLAAVIGAFPITVVVLS